MNAALSRSHFKYCTVVLVVLVLVALEVVPGVLSTIESVEDDIKACRVARIWESLVYADTCDARRDVG